MPIAQQVKKPAPYFSFSGRLLAKKDVEARCVILLDDAWIRQKGEVDLCRVVIDGKRWDHEPLAKPRRHLLLGRDLVHHGGNARIAIVEHAPRNLLAESFGMRQVGQPPVNAVVVNEDVGVRGERIAKHSPHRLEEALEPGLIGPSLIGPVLN